MRAIRTEVMRNRFSAIVEEASIVLYRTAHTTFIKQTQDYQCAMATTDGEVFAYPRFNGVSTLVGLSLKPAIDAIGLENFQPGDVVLTNDPYASHGVCTHMPDVFALRPIFANGRLQCFAWAFAHVSDIGGAVPSSISPTFTEIFQEGLRLRPVKLYKAGVLNEELLNVIRDNCRIPDQIWGDLKAICSALASMDRRMADLFGRYGESEIRSGIDDVLAYAEHKAREVVEQLPDGTSEFSDYLEVVPGQPIMVHCRMTVAGSDVTLDFAGSAPQVAAACNFVTGERPHPALVRAFVAYLLTAEPEMPRNGGIVRPITAKAPKGTIMNAEFPAACGNRAATYTRIYDLVLGCLNQAVPGGLAAAGGSQAAIISASVADRRTRMPRVAVIQPLIGGSGGRRSADGIDAIDTPFGFLRSTPTESVEHEMPLLVRRFGLTPDSFGPGRYRGGAALEIEMECREVEMTFSVRGCDRFTFQPWGVSGGQHGQCGFGQINGKQLSLIEVFKLKRGDRLYLRSPTGGGYGNPGERDPAAVLNDVLEGLLSIDAARRDYGVVIRDGAVDAAATAAERRGRAASNAPFRFGRRREEHEQRWSTASQVALADALLAAPAGIRNVLRLAVFERLPEGGSPAVVTRTVAEELRQMA